MADIKPYRTPEQTRNVAFAVTSADTAQIQNDGRVLALVTVGVTDAIITHNRNGKTSPLATLTASASYFLGPFPTTLNSGDILSLTTDNDIFISLFEV